MLKITPNYDFETSLGSPYNRGLADSYYLRGKNPHYFVESPYLSDRVTKLSKREIEAYNLGFEDNQKTGEHVDPGWLM